MGKKEKNKPVKKISKPVATAVIIAASVLAVHLIKFFLSNPSDSFGETPSSRTKGNPRAQVHIVEYLDFECPACAKGALALKEYLAKYPSQIYLEVKHYPISSMHP